MAPSAKALANLQKTEKLLKDEKFSQAYEKAKKALKRGHDKERYLLVLGKAAYGMRYWEQCVQHFEQLCKAFPENDAAKEGLRAAQARLAESRTGSFDFANLYKLAEKGIMNIDVADYVGPIEVADIPGKGKGMVATQDVKKGTLLLVSKAVAIIDNWQSVDDVAYAVAEKLKRRPEMADDISALYDGNPREAGLPAPKGIPDIERLAWICKYNCFSFDGKGGFNGWAFKGLWTLPSYFNHSCLRNAVHTFYVDVMAVFAAGDINEGEEVTLTYADPYDAYMERKELFMDYGFICKCRLCELDRADTRYFEREKLVQMAHNTYARAYELDDPSGAIEVLSQCLAKIRATYDGRPDLKPRLYEPLMMLAKTYRRSTMKDKYTAQIKLLLESAACLGDSLLTQVGDCLYARLAECYEQEGDDGNARKYAHMAVEVLRTRSGLDASLFKKMKPKVAEIDHLL